MMQGMGQRTANSPWAESISDGDMGTNKGGDMHKSVGTASSWLFPEHQASVMESREARLEGKQFPDQACLSMLRCRVQTSALSRAVTGQGWLPLGYKDTSLHICGNSGHRPSPALLPNVPKALHAFCSREQRAVSSFSIRSKFISMSHHKSIGTGSRESRAHG